MSCFHEFEVKKGISLEGSASVYPVFKLYSPRNRFFSVGIKASIIPEVLEPFIKGPDRKNRA